MKGRVLRGTTGDIEAIWKALYPRIKRLLTGGVVVTVPTTVAPHTHHASEIVMDPAGYIEADDVQEGLEELDDDKLARSGVQPMEGDLNMDDGLGPWSIGNVESVHLTGGVGEAVIDGVRALTMKGTTVGEDVIGNVRILHLMGDDTDDEALIDGVERITFNNEPTASVVEVLSRIDWNVAVTPGTDYTEAAGMMSWSDVEGVLVVNVASGPAA